LPTHKNRENKAADPENSELPTMTKTGQPSPTAKATEPHDPEPNPRNERDGSTPSGHAPNGQATKTPWDSATDWTKRADRAAKALPPNREASDLETEKTDKDAGENEPAANSAGRETPRREPENPTTGKEDTRLAKSEIIATKYKGEKTDRRPA
jgi:hypothetical protein